MIVDEGDAKKAIEHMPNVRQVQNSYESSFIQRMRPTKSEIQTFQALIDSRLFRKKTVVDFISKEDFEQIQEGYRKDRE
jgi:butyrate kinase